LFFGSKVGRSASSVCVVFASVHETFGRGALECERLLSWTSLHARSTRRARKSRTSLTAVGGSRPDRTRRVRTLEFDRALREDSIVVVRLEFLLGLTHGGYGVCRSERGAWTREDQRRVGRRLEAFSIRLGNRNPENPATRVARVGSVRCEREDPRNNGSRWRSITVCGSGNTPVRGQARPACVSVESTVVQDTSSRGNETISASLVTRHSSPPPSLTFYAFCLECSFIKM